MSATTDIDAANAVADYARPQDGDAEFAAAMAAVPTRVCSQAPARARRGVIGPG